MVNKDKQLEPFFEEPLKRNTLFLQRGQLAFKAVAQRFYIHDYQ